MKLDELHICDLHAGAPRHRHTVSGRDIRIGRVQINFAATAGRQHDPVRPDSFYFTGFLVQNIRTKATVFRREAELGCGDQIHGHPIFQKFGVWLPGQFA